MASYDSSDSERAFTPFGDRGSTSPCSCSSGTLDLAPPGRGTSQDVAIVGFSFEFPGANSEEGFWELLTQGKCAATPFPPDRLNYSRFQEKVSKTSRRPFLQYRLTRLRFERQEPAL